ncbi:hypothetical protein [Corynebacterium sp.]|uniref:hypothetical protein n=1 Tax=Corynebacterium sp. TaxID=1720 RepID=UPI0028A928CB|nr:hypothetical protein [Corynebacterium sp.]
MTTQDQSPSRALTVRPRLLLHLWCALLVGIVFWPFLCTLFSYVAPGSATPSLILRDMVVPHSMALNDLATARDGLPRAVPQDTVLAWLSPVVPPPVAVSVLMLVGGYAGALGAAGLVRQVVGDAGRRGTWVAGALAAVVTLWNPYVAERLLQGHWSVVLAGVLLPAVAVSVMRRSPASLVALVVLLLVSALTPTGLILATLTAAVAALVGAAPLHRALTVVGVGTVGAVLSLPWVIPTLVTTGADATRTDAAGAALFAAGAEPGVGVLGALAGLGGIWNADAVPASREALAPVSTGAGVVLALVAVVTAVLLWRRRRLRGAPLVWLALVSVVVPALMSTAPGIAVTGWFLEYVPGVGLVRDSQKFVVLALPGLVVLLASAVTPVVQAGRRTATACATAVLVLVWVAVPVLPRDLADLAPVQLDGVYDELVDQVTAWQDDHGTTARTLLWPPGNYRMIGGRPVLDPALKMLPGRPIDPGYLIVDGALVDGDPDTVAALNELASGEDTLADRGIDLVVVEDGGDGGSGGVDTRGVADVLQEHDELWSSGRWSLYAVDR